MRRNPDQLPQNPALSYTIEPPSIKNPQLLKIYADLQKKSILVGFWVNFLVITVVIYLLTLAIPSAAFTQTSYIYQCPDSVFKYYPDTCAQAQTTLSQNPNYWIGKISDISPLNQFLLLQVTFIKNSSLLQNKQFSTKVNVSIGMLLSNGDDSFLPAVNSSQTVQIDCLDISSNQCSDKYLAYMSELGASSYFFVIDFSQNTPTLDTWAANYQMKFVAINPEYSKFLLGTRYTLVIISFIANFLYIRRLRMVPYGDLVIEQKLLFVMGLLLILFNDPFAGLTVLYPNVASGFFSVFFTINFVVLVLLFWLVTFQRIYQENDKKDTNSFTIWKLIFISLIWIFLFVPYILLTVMKVSSPLISLDEGVANAYDVFKYLGLILVGIYCGTLLSYYIRICKVYDSRLWRHKTLFMFSNYFIFGMFLFIFMGGFNFRSNNGQAIFMEICILNMYIYFMQFLYCPTSEGIKESFQFVSQEHALKYNAFDLLDDKEEDLNIDFEASGQQQHRNEIEIHQEKQPTGLQVIDFQEEEHSQEKIEDLNQSRDKKADVFI